jgi:hypothetical protein
MDSSDGHMGGDVETALPGGKPQVDLAHEGARGNVGVIPSPSQDDWDDATMREKAE